MGKIPASQSLQSLMKMKNHDKRDLWLMKLWTRRGHKNRRGRVSKGQNQEVQLCLSLS